MVTSIYKVAQGLRNKMEREVLAEHGLSWTAFSMLYDLWIWESVETKRLAELTGVSKATVSNITKTLERKRLLVRETDARDRRITHLLLTDAGKDLMRELYPRFHQGEKEIASGLTGDEQRLVASLMRRVIVNME
ncbi:MarR family transcriptional regulator [Paenalkalicoccus suaedae]|uniref:MarR family transcriptional regulator n=2 Tax=Paenalkalicoccus suaedae TaxID=2592382 RepID=A0A859FKD1_9BACI|nr:MarR family transcriptional regulator [Paenalkalicoccus suaedae]